MLPKIKVIGVGGSGSNTVSRIVKSGIEGVELIAVNTDVQALHFCRAPKKILIGKNTTKGLGAGMNVQVGRAAAEESRSELAKTLQGADMVFITCGAGGGTGSGVAPIIAEISKSLGILTVAIVTTPFTFEGEQRKKIAADAIRRLAGHVDSLLVIANDNLLKIIDEKTTVSNAFQMCDDILLQAVRGIADLIIAPGIINIDFASMVSILKNSGRALFGTGKAMGEHRAAQAAQRAVDSPLLDFSIHGAKGILFNVAGADVTLNEIKEASSIIAGHADPKAKILFGAVKDATLRKGEIKVTVIATR